METKRERKDHIKYVFLFRDKSTRKFTSTNVKPRYLFGYLTDDHKIFFDEFRLMDVFNFRRGMLRQFLVKTQKHYIDSRTEVGYFFGMDKKFKLKDLMFMLWTVYHRGYGFQMKKINLGETAYMFNKLYNLNLFSERFPGRGYTMKSVVAMTKLCEIYDILLENKVCSWINDEFNERIARINKPRRKYYKIVTTMLYYMCIRNYKRYQKQYGEAKRRYLSKKLSIESAETMINTDIILKDKTTKENTNGESK